MIRIEIISIKIKFEGNENWKEKRETFCVAF